MQERPFASPRGTRRRRPDLHRHRLRLAGARPRHGQPHEDRDASLRQRGEPAVGGAHNHLRPRGAGGADCRARPASPRGRRPRPRSPRRAWQRATPSSCAPGRASTWGSITGARPALVQHLHGGVRRGVHVENATPCARRAQVWVPFPARGVAYDEFSMQLDGVELRWRSAARTSRQPRPRRRRRCPRPPRAPPALPLARHGPLELLLRCPHGAGARFPARRAHRLRQVDFRAAACLRRTSGSRTGAGSSLAVRQPPLRGGHRRGHAAEDQPGRSRADLQVRARCRSRSSSSCCSSCRCCAR